MSLWTTDFEYLLRRHCHFVGPQDSIDPDARLAALGVDSLAFLALLVEVEARFSVAVPDTMLAEGNDTPRGLWQLVSGLTDQQRRGVR